jgi:eukaryotic-like serine/threonine-protein kinase
MTTQDDQPAVPRTIGRYEVIAEIASGGMGVVYLARHAGEAGFQRLFAIKLMHPHLAEDRLFVDMLRDEARIAAHIHHPNVVPILDLGSEGGRHYVVMEFIDGCSLSALLARNKQHRPPELVVPIVIDALEGLHAAHTLCDVEGTPLKLVHRDVSPQNVLLGVDGTARLTDFGIAKAETRITSTRPGMRKGKLSYMAPEQIKEDGEHIDLRADIFAAGALLWGALTGQHLFRAASDGATLHNILNKPVAAASTVGLRPPPAFDAICAKALDRVVDKRYSSALEMADALREAMAALALRASRGAVADWVKTSFAAELTARNGAIRTVTQRSRPPPADESLPALPPLADALLSQSGSEPPPALPVPSSTTVSSTRTLHFGAEEATQADIRPRFRLLVVGGITAAAIALLTLWAATQPSASAGNRAAASALPAPEQAASALARGPAIEPVPSSEPAASSAEAPAREPPARAVATLPKRGTPAPARPRREGDKPPPKPTSTSAPATTGVKIEKNPYLRRE